MSTPTGQLPRPCRSLAGSVAIVSGAGNQGMGIGNGRAISILLAEDGASVVCIDRDLEAARVTASMIQEEGKGRAIAHYADVTKDADCAEAVAAALNAFGRVDILINNVGVIGAKGTAVEVDREEWSACLEINVSSMMLMAKHAIPAMSRNETDSGGIRGAIVNMGSVAGLQGGTPSLLYPTSKGAVVNMTRAMAAHHAKDGIRVNCVCPGMLFTPMMYGGQGGMSTQMREARRKRSLLQTEGNAWDAAGAVRYLSGKESRWITGTVMTVDAGATCASMLSSR
ncbi:related to dehydrogenases with different specificities (related to short-chain alcohol dehydrogenases) [Cephalotrichum gorgonifer]|uniref:Related to dehydrogenases with different specificities (Related to short-chain alcohol dehydrogenases) n=1 Tax=Cephalotrichum gorgonifer TaxID=2041049 RepID=A0AAE8N7C7_9PEZI|nr:related to dehydrogenases with different specificities (related to short-chain alcohol dehydrogenases) [Cephalotrichum gorgonifer]